MRNNKVGSIIEGLTKPTIDFYRKGSEKIRYIRGDIEHINERKVDINKISDKNKHGNCYEAAMKQMIDFHEKGIKDVVLVHGIVTGQGELEGVQFGHAWVELNNMVFDVSNGREVVMPKVKYYAIGKIKITRVYDYQQMLEKVTKYETYGPWDKVFDKFY